MKKRILFFGHLPPPSSGEGNILKSFFQSLPKSQYELRLMEAGIRDSNTTPAKISLYNFLRMFKHIWQMFWICLTWRPHYVHIFLTAGPAVFKFGILGIIAQMTGAQLVANHQSGLIIEQYDQYSKTKKAIVRWILRLPQAWIATSKGWGNWLTDHSVNPQKVEIIPNAVKMELPWAFRDIKRTIRSPESCFKLLTVGAVGYRKGTDLMAQICAKLEESGVNYHLTIAGVEEHPGEMEKIKAMFIDMVGDENYEFAGQLEYDQLINALKSAHALVFPTRGDNYPVAVAEAMMAGLPIIATRIGAIPEMVDNGSTGLLVNEEDVDGMVEHITALFDDPELCLRMGNKAREVALKRNTPEQVGMMLHKLLKSMSEPGPGIGDAYEHV
ncbi:glycosyltransferase [Candidatus Poribacteria bacterium]|nr:glycosyltransferase [Candidatus Poribacteria bacterium]